MVGTAIAGTINGNANIIHINNNVAESETIDSFGGIIGSVSEGGDVTINDVIIKFTNEAVVTANSFGGFVSKVAGTIKFTGCSIEGDKLKINSQKNAKGQKGLLVGEIIKIDGESYETLEGVKFELLNENSRKY